MNEGQQPIFGLRLIGNAIEGDIVGKALLFFNEGLTRKARFEIGTQIEFMDDMYRQVEKLLSDGHIKHIMNNLEELQKLHAKYKDKQFERRRRVDEIEK